jgi:hypothetical protein
MSSTFLTREEVAELTGRKRKSLQIEALRHMKIPFFVNPIGTPVVARVAVEGHPTAVAVKPKVWVMPD